MMMCEEIQQMILQDEEFLENPNGIKYFKMPGAI
jgi:hypothetical protein